MNREIRISRYERFVRIVDDRRNSDSGEAHASDILSVIVDSLEIPAQVANIVRFTIWPFEFAFPSRPRAPLILVVIAGITIDKAVCQNLVNSF
jgi:hypothetical protein